MGGAGLLEDERARRCHEVVLEVVPAALERVHVHGAVVVVGRDALPGANRLMITQVPVTARDTEHLRLDALVPHRPRQVVGVEVGRDGVGGDGRHGELLGSLRLLDTVRLEQVPSWPMPLAPAARTMIDQLQSAGGPPLWEMSVEDARSISAVMGAMDQPPEVAAVEDRVIPGPDGDLTVRIYTPDAPAPRPVVSFFHGGGFVICSIETHDGLSAAAGQRQRRGRGQRRVPARARRALPRFGRGLLHGDRVGVRQHAAELGGDPDRLIVAGDDAGGNLAAVVRAHGP